MKRLCRWLILLNKRLYKKATFVILLVLIPLTVVALSLVFQEDSGFVTIALGQENPDDALASEIVAELTQNQRVIRFVPCETAEQAEAMVTGHRADAAWVIAADLQEKLNSFLKTRHNREAVVTVLLREETVPLRLANEKLAGVLYRRCAPALYRQYVRNDVAELDSVSDEELMSYYLSFEQENDLFQFAYPDGDSGGDYVSGGYLVAPLRGLLSVFVLLGGLAAAMFYKQDERRGVFAWVRQSRLPFIAAGCQGIAVVNLTAVMLASLAIAGITGSLLRELVAALLYAVCCTSFCFLLSQLIRPINVLGMITPPLIVCAIVTCPIFFDFGALRLLQLLLPPTYYLHAVHSNRYLLYGALYALACIVLGLLFSHLRRPKRHG